MSEQGAGRRELVFCHACENEWLRGDHGLECPQCHSDVVEIIDERHDPRDNHITISDNDDDNAAAINNSSNDRLPQHPLHHYSPWRENPPDPDGGNIEHVVWNPVAGVQFSRTSFRSTAPGGMGPRPGQGATDVVTPIFQTISSLMGGAVNAQARTPGSPTESQNRIPSRTSHIHRSELASQNPFPDHLTHHHHHGAWNPGGAQGGRSVFSTAGRWTPNEGAGPFPGDRTGDNLHAYVNPFLSLQASRANAGHGHSVFATLIQSMQAGMMDQAGAQPNGMHTFLSSLLGNGTHGDAVYTEEALDRIVTQLMDQTGAHSAPGPASAAAIASLPKLKADKSMLGENGKAECSVCMDSVEIGDEVTVLPCKHWFHGECVGAWLKEHDTCPHCRQGIMPKDTPANASTPRSPDQAPRYDQNDYPPLDQGPPAPLPRGQQAPIPSAFLQPGMQQPYMPGGFREYPEPRNFVAPSDLQQGYSPHSSLPPSPQHHRNDYGHRRRSSTRDRSSGNGGEGSSGGQGVSSWFRNLRGGSNNGDR